MSKIATSQTGITKRCPLCVLFVCLISLQILAAPRLTAQDSTALRVITLVPNPAPQQLSSAKQALQNGQIVMMEGDDVVRFDGLLDVGLETEPQANATAFGGETPRVLRVVAARLAGNGSLDSFECYAPRRYEEKASIGEDCNTAFQAWVNQEEQEASGTTGLPEPLAADWTQLGRPDIVYFDNNHNELDDYVRLYRLNDNDFQYDWYLVIRDPRSSPNYTSSCSFFKNNCGFVTQKRDFQTSLNEYASNPGFSVYQWSPQNEIKYTNGTVDIGTALAGVVPQPGVGVSINWTQADVDTLVYSNVRAKETSWVEKFTPSTLTYSNPNNSTPFNSHNAMIFQVPEGTTTFNARLYTYFESHWQNSQGGYNSSKTERRFVALSAPVFQVAPRTVTVMEGGTVTLALQAGLPDYNYQGLRWTVSKVPEGFSVSPMSGSGPAVVTVRARGAEAGEVDDIEFDTNPPQAAPSVARQPLQVQISVVAKPADLPPHGVLLAGGQDWNNVALSSSEVWNPATNTSTLTYPMSAARYKHTATRLSDGTILITGGYDSNGVPQSSAEIFDLSTQKFTLLTSSMATPRAEQTAILFSSGPLAGKVLIAGGCCDSNNRALSTAELYDPATQTFTPTGTMPAAALGQAAALLPNGTVLLAGGTNAPGSLTSLSTAEIYNPQTRSFQLAGDLKNARQGQSATSLQNGQVLVAGGWRVGDDPTRTAELYTLGSGSFTLTGNMGIGRRYHAAALLFDGTVLTVGGLNGADSAQVYDPSTGAFTWTSTNMSEYRDHPTATLILNTETAADTQVLVAGGVQTNSGPTGGKGLELYDPIHFSFATAGTMTTPRTGLTATAY